MNSHIRVAWSRHALADALANAPSLWTLGNAGLAALQVQLYPLNSTFGLLHLLFASRF